MSRGGFGEKLARFFPCVGERHRGIVTDRNALPIRTALRVGFGYEQDLTFYAAHGDLFAYFCALVTTIALGYSLLRPAVSFTGKMQ